MFLYIVNPQPVTQHPIVLSICICLPILYCLYCTPLSITVVNPQPVTRHLYCTLYIVYSSICSCSKPKANPQLVAQQVTAQLQQLLPPALPRKDKHPAKRTIGDRERGGGGGDTTAGETDTSLDSIDTLHRTPTVVLDSTAATTASLPTPPEPKRK